MRNLITLVTAGLLLSSAAVAAQAATGAGTTAAATAQPDNPKRTACRNAWKAQTTHTGAKKDFMHACMGKS